MWDPASSCGVVVGVSGILVQLKLLSLGFNASSRQGLKEGWDVGSLGLTVHVRLSRRACIWAGFRVGCRVQTTG